MAATMAEDAVEPTLRLSSRGAVQRFFRARSNIALPHGRLRRKGFSTQCSIRSSCLRAPLTLAVPVSQVTTLKGHSRSAGLGQVSYAGLQTHLLQLRLGKAGADDDQKPLSERIDPTRSLLSARALLDTSRDAGSSGRVRCMGYPGKGSPSRPGPK